jgi:DNA-binding NarL/FixJ family response regulator
MVDKLTKRERVCALLVAEGLSNTQIARDLYVEPTTVKQHINHIYEQLALPRDCNRRVLLARLVIERERGTW